MVTPMLIHYSLTASHAVDSAAYWPEEGVEHVLHALVKGWRLRAFSPHVRGGGVMAPSEAEQTSAAYLAKTPLV